MIIQQNSRIQHHQFNGVGQAATVPTQEDFTNPAAPWLVTDLVDGEIGVNTDDQKIYIRIGSTIKEISTGGGISSNIGNSNLTITDPVRELTMGGNGLTTDNFTINDYQGNRAFQVNGNRTITFDTKITGSAGLLHYCNGQLSFYSGSNGITFPTGKSIYTNSIVPATTSNPIRLGSQLGGTSELNYDGVNGWMTFKPNSTSSPVPTTIPVEGFGIYPDVTNGVGHVSFKNDNNDIISLFKGAAITAINNTATDGTIATNDTITNNNRTRIEEIEQRLQALGIIA